MITVKHLSVKRYITILPTIACHTPKKMYFIFLVLLKCKTGWQLNPFVCIFFLEMLKNFYDKFTSTINVFYFLSIMCCYGR